MNAETEQLLASARRVRANAYAPYSGFSVGAALLDVEGHVHVGTNVENASYGLTTCAEQAALAAAVASGARSFRAIAVVGPSGAEPCMPCGRCRQLLHEFSPELDVITTGPDRPRIVPLASLLPHPFGPPDLAGSDSGAR